MKHMTNMSKDDIEDITTTLGDVAVKTTFTAIREGLQGDATMFCKHCGESIDADSKFCKKCGKMQ